MPQQDQQNITVADWLAECVATQGVLEAHGVCGREITALWVAAITRLAARHARHESGGVFAAIGSALVSDRPVLTFSTTGPGLSNSITGLETARAAGVKLIHLSPLTPAAERGRLGIQDTGPSGYGNDDLHRAGRLFDHVTLLESPAQLPQLAAQLAAGFAGPGAFLAHVAVPVDVQRMRADAIPLAVPAQQRPAPGITPRIADELAATLASEPFAVWVGAGARRVAPQVRELLDRTGAPVISTPRGLGIADGHPQFLGVSGNGGSPTLPADLARWGVARTLVLGTGLGEASTGWIPELVPPGGFVHVDLDPSVFGRAYPQAATLGLQAGVAEVLDALLARRLVHRQPPRRTDKASAPAPAPSVKRGVVHPRMLMAAIQRIVVEGSAAHVFADASTAMFLAARHLRFAEPGRFHIEPHFGAMGMAGAAVVGAASAAGQPAVAICGDGSVHMQDEISTAVRYGLPAVWVVLNDDGLGIVRHGMRRNGNLVHDADYPSTDFAAVARAKGAQAARVTCARSLDRALRQALVADGPFLIDVVVDRSVAPPLGLRAAR